MPTEKKIVSTTEEDKIIPTIEEDKNIIEQILAGDINKFAILQKKYYYMLLTLIRKIIKDADDVEDVMQESFIKAYKNLASYNFEFTFSSWLYKIASNCCIDFLRKKRDLSYDSFENKDNEEGFQIEDSYFLPDENIINNERTKIIESAVNKLPKKYIKLFKLRYEDEIQIEELADKLNMPIGTIKTHLFRARKIVELTLRKYPVFFDIMIPLKTNK